MLLPHVFVLPVEDFRLYVHSNITDYRLDRGSYYRLMWQLEPLNTEHHIDPKYTPTPGLSLKAWVPRELSLKLDGHCFVGRFLCPLSFSARQ
jgi:hypothetical protein